MDKWFIGRKALHGFLDASSRDGVFFPADVFNRRISTTSRSTCLAHARRLPPCWLTRAKSDGELRDRSRQKFEQPDNEDSKSPDSRATGVRTQQDTKRGNPGPREIGQTAHGRMNLKTTKKGIWTRGGIRFTRVGE